MTEKFTSMADKFTVTEKRYNSAFLLDKAKLTRMLSILEQKFTDAQLPFNPVYNVTFSNGKEVFLTSPNDLFSLDNTVRNPINTLTILIHTQPNEHDKRTLLSAIGYRSDGSGYNIKLSITSRDAKWVDQLFAELEEQIERTLLNSWIYKYLKSRVGLYILILMLGFLMGAFLVFRASGLSIRPVPVDTAKELIQKANQASSLEDKIDFLFELNKKQLEVITDRPQLNIQSFLNWKGFFITLPLLIALGCVIYTVGWCYPNAVFLWGDYEEYYASLVSKRKALWNLVIGSTIFGIMTNLFAWGVTGFIQ